MVNMFYDKYDAENFVQEYIKRIENFGLTIEVSYFDSRIGGDGIPYKVKGFCGMIIKSSVTDEIFYFIDTRDKLIDEVELIEELLSN